jgi:hypothetical protein
MSLGEHVAHTAAQAWITLDPKGAWSLEEAIRSHNGGITRILGDQREVQGVMENWIDIGSANELSAVPLNRVTAMNRESFRDSRIQKSDAMPRSGR